MKKLKTALLTILFSAFLNTANAQQIEQETLSFADATEVSINNGRRLMLHYVQNRNFARVADIYHFLNEKTEAGNCIAFTLSEELLIVVLIHNWDDFFAIAEHFSYIADIPLCIPVHYDYSLFLALHAEVENNVSQLFENALAVGLTPEEKQLLQLYFHLIEHGRDERYRQRLRAFRQEHPQSGFNDFISSYLPSEYGFMRTYSRSTPVRWKIGFKLGATQVFPTGNFSNYFSSTTGFNFATDARFNNFLVGIQLDGGSMRLRTPLLRAATGYEHDFQEGDRLQFFSFSIPVGYTIIRSNRLEITPFASFLGLTDLISTIHPRNEDGGLDRSREFTVVSAFSAGAGLRTEYQLARINMDDYFMAFHLRFEAGYYIPVRFRYAPARGNTFKARIGIVWWFSGIF